MAHSEWAMVIALVVAYFLMLITLVVLVARQTAQRFGAWSTLSVLWVIGTILFPWIAALIWLVWDGVSDRLGKGYRG